MTDPARLRDLFDYDPETGLLRWKIDRQGGAHAGDIVQSRDGHGYIQVTIDAKNLRAHRVIWAMCHGQWPSGQIDHINGVRDDNRISNLRVASPRQNSSNLGLAKTNTSGFRGVSYSRARGKWEAYIRSNGKHVHLGRFDRREDAVRARDAAARSAFGEFYNPARAGTGESI